MLFSRLTVFIGVLLCTLQSNPAFSQAAPEKYLVSVKSLSVEDGMASREVICGLQDKLGFIWFATRNGLNRYDGKKFMLYTEKNGMRSRKVVDMAQDDRGFIWLLYGVMGYDSKTCNKVDLLDIRTHQLISFDKRFKNAPFKESDIAWLKSSGDNGVFFWVKPNIFYYYHPRSGFLKLAEEPGVVFKSLYPKFDAIRSRSAFIFQQNKRLALVNNTEKALFPELNFTAKPIVYTGQNSWLTLYTSNVGENVKLKRVSPQGLTDYTENQIDPKWLTNDDNTYTFYDSRSNSSVIYSVGKGILYFKDQFILLNAADESIVNNTLAINYYFSDNQNRIWLCTTTGVKVYEVKPNKFSHYFTQVKSLSNNHWGSQARGILTDEYGSIYGQIWHDLLCLKPNQKEPVQLPTYGKELNYALIRHGDKILSANRTLQIFDLKTGKPEATIFQEADAGSLPPEIWSVFTLSNNTVLCGHTLGIKMVDLEKKVFKKVVNLVPNAPEPQFVYQFFRDNSGQLYATCMNGLFRLNNKGEITAHFSAENANSDFKIPYTILLHVYVDRGNNFWMATDGDGIYEWNPKTKKVAHYTIADGLSSNVIYRIEPDDFGNLWLSSDFGLMRFNIKEKTTQTFTTKDGISNNEFNRVSSYRAPDGRLFFGCLDGVNAFYPKDFSTEVLPFSTPLQIISYSKFSTEEGKLADCTYQLFTENKIVLKAGEHFFNLEFALLDFDEGIHHYAYRINGIDRDWNYINENTLRISGLPYGKFELEIKGQNILGQWSNDVIRIPIWVKAPIYQQTWFIVLCALIFGSIVTFYFVLRNRKIKRDREKLELKVEERTLQLKQSLEQREVLLKEIHHRVKNNLQVISSLFDLQAARITDDYALKILQEGQGRVRSIALLHHQLYQQEDFTGVKLNKFVNDLYRQVFEVFKKPDKPITFVCDLPDTIIFLDVAIALGLILNELFSNAFKFALYQVEQPTLKVSISQLKDDYILTVSDNGPGMPEGFDYKKSRSLGIHIIRQLSRQIQGKMEYSYKNGSHFNIYFKNTIQ